MPNWDSAVKEDKPFVGISSAVGRYNNAVFLGFTDTWSATNNCFDCNALKPAPPDPDCRKCKGRGTVVDEMIGLRYDLGNGTQEQEQMTFKITPPASFTKNGQRIVTRASKLYDRLLELSGLYQPGPGDLGRWAKANQDCRVACTIKIEQPNKYPKITVVLRNEPETSASQAFTQAAQESLQGGGLAVEPPEVRAARSKAFKDQQSGKEPVSGGELFDDEMPF